MPSLLLALAPAALALDADTFEMAGSSLDLQGGLQVSAPAIGWPGSSYAGLGLVYANDPLVRADDGTPIVAHSFATHLLGGFNVGGRLRLEVDAPIYPWVAGQDGGGLAVGDTRVGALVPLVTRETTGVGVAVLPAILLPTGSPEAFTGTGGLGASLTVAAGFAPTSKVFVDVNAGALATRSSALGDMEFGSGLAGGLGVGLRPTDAVVVGAELDAFLDLAGGAGAFEHPIEAHAYGTWASAGGVVATLGVGTGLVAGVGAPDARVVLAVGYRQPGVEPVRDADGDGVYDDADACVSLPEDADGFEDGDGCPDLDDDGDGLADTIDACPREAEDVDAFEDEDGCPDPDNDGDDVPDAVDACPTEAGPAALHGCPDRDEDDIPDRDDKCPDQARDPREDVTRSDGCPKRVIVTIEKIEISEKIFFDTNKSSIKPESAGLLEEIAATLRDNPDLTRVEVAGHTDNVGSDAFNQRLSQGRAEAVVRWLVEQGGVDAARLTAVGYGETRPIETNATEEGRAANRRVEFVILERAPAEAPSPEDGP